MMWIFDEVKPLNTWLIDSWMVDNLDLALNRYSNNNRRLNLITMYDDGLYSVSVDDDNFTLLMSFSNFVIFPCS